MKITLEQVNNKVHFLARDEQGAEVHFDGAAGSELGEGQGMRPMHAVLSALAACSAYDLVMMLKKARQPLEKLEAVVEAERADDIPAVFTRIHIHFRLYGNVDEKRTARFVRMSVEQYCSVAAMLEKTATIGHGYEIIPGEPD